MAPLQPLLACARRTILRQHLPTTLPRSARAFTSTHLLRTSQPPPSHELTTEEAERQDTISDADMSAYAEEEIVQARLEEERLIAIEKAELEEEERLKEEEELEGEEGELEVEAGKPKINTWFLNPSPAPSPGSSAPQPRQPRFTTFDRSPASPSSTPTSPHSQLSAPPLPSTAPPSLLPLYEFLTSHTTLAGEVILPHTVQFFDTREGSAALEAQETPEGAGEGWENAVRMSGMLGSGTPATPNSGSFLGATAAEVRRIRRAKTDQSLPESGEVFEGARGETFGPAWEWVGVVQVKGRGRGVVGRADGVIRRWLLQNPLSPTVEPVTIPNPKTPRIDPDADWSIVPIKGTRICLNLLTEEGRVRWRLEEMWGGKEKRARGRLYSPKA
ncbi:hypothetical protein IAT38_007765 [Cryptococcus sp. DSM 104549]